MPMMDEDPIIFLFNSPLASGCDYVLQTMKIVSRTHPVYGLALGDIISLPQLLCSQDTSIVRHVHGAVIIRPVSVFPGLRFRCIRILAYIVFAIALRIYVDCRHRSRNTFLWFFEPFHIPSLLSVFFGYRTVYDCVDYYPGFHRSARNEHDQLMRKSTHVFANSKILARMVRSSRADVVTVPLGFAHELFDEMLVSPVRPKKRVFTVGYIGSISDRMNFELLQTVIAKLPYVMFVFAGVFEPNVFGAKDKSKAAFEKLIRKKNVRRIPQVAKQNIPALLTQFDIGIIPYRSDLAFNRYAFPMKVMEYFASGRPVISTHILALEQYAKDGLLLLADSPDAFVRCIERYKKKGWNGANQKRQIAVAARNHWAMKVNKIINVIYKNTP